MTRTLAKEMLDIPDARTPTLMACALVAVLTHIHMRGPRPPRFLWFSGGGIHMVFGLEKTSKHTYYGAL